MVVRELLVAVRDAKLIHSPHEPTSTVQQIELIVLAAVDVERLQPSQVVGVGFDRDDRVFAASNLPTVQIETSRPISTTASTGSLKYSVRWAELRCMKANNASTHRGKAFSSSPGTTVSWPT
jgi:hypothetical protein